MAADWAAKVAAAAPGFLSVDFVIFDGKAKTFLEQSRHNAAAFVIKDVNFA